MQIRLNKYLADQGVCSRREAEKLMDQGAVKVNGKTITEQGVKIDPEKDKVEVSEKAIQEREQKKVVYALNKPLAYVCSTHKTKVERKIVIDLLDVPERVYPVGRLDKETTGLILLTNDGDLAYQLTHPSFEHKKVYLVELNKPLVKGALDKLREGVNLFGSKTLPTKIKKISATKFYITLKEGKNRQIRRIVRKVGSQVKSLQRVQIGSLKLDELNIKIGEFKKLDKKEIEKLLTNL